MIGHIDISIDFIFYDSRNRRRNKVDLISGGQGRDTATYVSSISSVTVNPAAGTGSGGDAAGDLLASIENLEGSAGNDSLTGGGGNDAFTYLSTSDIGDTITDFSSSPRCNPARP